jgi:hypothetical protein
VAFDSVPHGADGAERYLAAVVRALAALPRLRLTFVARSTAGACSALPSDSLALGPSVAIREAGPASPEFARLMALPNAALLLPLAFFATCSGSGANASSEDYSAALLGLPARGRRRPPLAVFAFDAQAFRLQALARHEPSAAQAQRFAAAAAAEGAREAALYARADVFAALTPEDLASISPAWTRPGVPRLVVQFRDEVDARLSGSGSGAAAGAGALTPLARALRHRATLPPFAARSGFVFMGGGNNPTNALALHFFLLRVWPALRARLPQAQLHIIGAPPTRLCREHGVWCGWLAGTPYEGDAAASAGITVHGMVEDPRSVLARARVALAPLVCGTGINTKTGYYMAQGLPVVGTEKGIRGYGEAAGLEGGGGFSAIGSMAAGAESEAMAAECARLHEGQEAWEAASTGALQRTARLEDERAQAADLQALVRALRQAAEGGAAAED